MAALYQALENTILTTSALEHLSYDTMKELIGEEIGSVDSKSDTDFDIIQEYYDCE